MNSVMLSRLLFCAGHVAKCQVIHCELNIVKEWKKLSSDNHSKAKVSVICAFTKER